MPSELAATDDDGDNMSDFQRELVALLNRFSRENQSNTPDFVLAEFLIDCLQAFDCATERRREWRGEPRTAVSAPALSDLPRPPNPGHRERWGA